MTGTSNRRQRTLLSALVLCPALLVFAACSRTTGVTRLPLAGAEMIKVGVEARPAIRLPHDQRVSWVLHGSAAGRLELAFALARDDQETDIGAVFRVYRTGLTGRWLLAERRLTGKDSEEWVTLRVPWARRPWSARLTVEAEATYRGQAVRDALMSPALVAEPTLAPAVPDDARPCFIVFLVDTLRADFVGAYGGRWTGTTHEMDRLASEGWRVGRVLSPATWTLPAHASLFTSTSVARHQVGATRQALGPGLPTLAETLSARGYRCLAVTSGGFVDPGLGLGRGFARYVAVDIGREDVSAEVRRALALVAEYRSEPFFLFLHTYQVHAYARGRDEEFDTDRARVATTLRRRYAEEVAKVDAALGELRRGLRSLGVDGRTNIVLTSDHGEMLDDRPALPGPFLFGHGHPYLHDEELRVPLIWLDPHHPGGGKVYAGPASLLDIAPTVVAMAGATRPSSFEGAVLPAAAADASETGDRELVADAAPHEAVALERAARKLILRPQRTLDNWWRGGSYPPLPAEEFYDLAADPLETHPLPPESPQAAGLRSDAAWRIGEAYPGCVLIRAPASGTELRLRVTARSGIRKATLFGDKAEDTVAVDEQGLVATALIRPGACDVVAAIEPTRARDRVEVSVFAETSPSIAFGDGTRVEGPSGQARWTSLLRGSRQLEAGDVVIFASGLAKAAAQPSHEAPLDSLLVAQLRSLAYVAVSGTVPLAATHRHKDVLIPPVTETLRKTVVTIAGETQ